MSIYSIKSSKMESSPPPPPPPSPPPPPRTRFTTRNSGQPSSSSPGSSSESEELRRLDNAPPFWKSKKRLSKQLSMCETHRDVAWEKRRRQMLRQERRKSMVLDSEDTSLLCTDEDLDELKGSIELGFGFHEDAIDPKLCNTLPALDLYFAVNRQLSPSPGSTPHSRGSSGSMAPTSSSLDSPRSEDSWKICGPGEDPQQVKMKLRHWAQAVACSVMQSI